MNQIILNCLVRVGTIQDKEVLADVVRKMPAVDRMIILIALRRCSVDDIFTIRMKPPGVSELKTYDIDLSKLERREMEDPSVRQFTHVLESTGRTVVWHVMDGEDETWLSDVQERLKEKDRMTLQILARVEKVDDVPFERGSWDRKSRQLDARLKTSLQNAKALTLRERNELRTLFDDHEGFFDTTLELDYTDDDGKPRSFKAEIPLGDKDFFFPRGASRNSKTNSSTSQNSGTSPQPA